MNFTMIVGLPGSGKTTLAHTFKLDNPLAMFIDDPKDFQKDILDKIDSSIQNQDTLEVIVADPWFCLEDVRKAAEAKITEKYKDISISWIFFDNNLESCYSNLERRRTQGDTREIGKQLEFFHKNYSIPAGVSIRKCYAPHNFKMGDRVFCKSQNVFGYIIGHYSDVIMQVLFDDSALRGPEFMDSMELTLVQDPGILLKELL